MLFTLDFHPLFGSFNWGGDMKASDNILIETATVTLTNYAVYKKLAFMYGNMPLSLEETFNERGCLILFLYEAKSMYESIYKDEFIASIFGYKEDNSFPLGMIEDTGECIIDYIPTLYSAKNYENVLIFSIHSLIQLKNEHDTNMLPLDDLHARFVKNYIQKAD